MATVMVSGGKAYVTLTNNCNVAVDINGQMEESDTGFVVTGSGSSKGNPYRGPPMHTISVHNNPPLTNVPATNGSSVYLVCPGTTPPATGSWTTLHFLQGFTMSASASRFMPTKVTIGTHAAGQQLLDNHPVFADSGDAVIAERRIHLAGMFFLALPRLISRCPERPAVAPCIWRQHEYGTERKGIVTEINRPPQTAVR